MEKAIGKVESERKQGYCLSREGGAGVVQYLQRSSLMLHLSIPRLVAKRSSAVSNFVNMFSLGRDTFWVRPAAELVKVIL